MLSDERLKEIREREAAATKGPWYSDAYSRVFSEPLTREYTKNDGPDYPDYCHQRPEGQSYQDWYKEQAAANEADPVIATVPRLVGDTAYGRHAADREFIAEARQDIPDLLAMVDALTKQREEWRELAIQQSALIAELGSIARQEDR